MTGPYRDIEQPSSGGKAGSQNMVANTTKVIAWITYVFGLIAGFVIAVDVDFPTAIVIWIATLICGTLILALSEIIRLLEQVVDREK